MGTIIYLSLQFETFDFIVFGYYLKFKLVWRLV